MRRELLETSFGARHACRRIGSEAQRNTNKPSFEAGVMISEEVNKSSSRIKSSLFFKVFVLCTQSLGKEKRGIVTCGVRPHG